MRPTTKSDPRMWLDQHGDVLYRFALARVGNRTAAEDLVQDTLLAGLRARDTFAEQSSERTWLVGILKHRIADHFRRLALQEKSATDEAKHPRDEFFTGGGKWLRPPFNWSALPDSAVEIDELTGALQDCLSGLPDRLAAAVALREIAGLDTNEVCKELQVTPTHLWTLLHRARLRLRECLEINWFRNDARGAANATKRVVS